HELGIALDVRHDKIERKTLMEFIEIGLRLVAERAVGLCVEGNIGGCRFSLPDAEHDTACTKERLSKAKQIKCFTYVINLMTAGLQTNLSGKSIFRFFRERAV